MEYKWHGENSGLHRGIHPLKPASFVKASNLFVKPPGASGFSSSAYMKFFETQKFTFCAESFRKPNVCGMRINFC